MGQAKIQAARKAAEAEAIASIDIDRVATAIRKLFSAASRVVGMDCLDHAVIGVALLGRLGVPAKVVVGYAAWRVGGGDGDVVSHAPEGQMIQGQGNLLFHAWIEVAGKILDLTTYQLKRKAALMDAADGGRTTVDWAPDYLFIDKTAVRSHRDVAQLEAGLCHYRRDESLERRVVAQLHPVDPLELQMVLAVYHNPQVEVIGPNQMLDNASAASSPAKP